MKRQILTFLLVFLCGAMAIAQTKTVKGAVVDESNEPLIGVSVLLLDSTSGTMTDLDGNYVLEKVPENATICFSYFGMHPQEIKVNGQSVINVTMKVDNQNLEEVVVIGYGSAKAKDLTAPITVIQGDDISSSPTSSPMAALQGKVPGVNIVNSGVPGQGATVQIRGMGSFSSSQPLYVVDGMFYDNINFLNNDDIQEMSILKDASAAAIYGVKAANGVVIITTKKGKRYQKAKVTYNGYVGVQTATNVLEMCNAHEYATMLTEANEEAYSPVLEASIQKWGGNYDSLTFGADTDWYDELLRPAVMTNHSLSISGGSDRATYSTGLSYLSQDGIMDVENYYRRLNFRAQLEYDATSWLKIGFNGVFSNSTQRLPNNSAWQNAFNMPSIMPVYDNTREESFPNKYAGPDQIGYTANFYNPVATANYYNSKNDTYQVLSNFFAQFFLIPNKLDFRTSYAYDYSSVKGRSFTAPYYVSSWQQATTSSLTKSVSTYNKWIWDNVLTYKDQWGQHGFGAMLGYSMRQDRYHYLAGTATDVPEGAEEYWYLGQGNSETARPYENGTRYRSQSVFARLNYDYAGKYLLMFTMRADGTSKYQEKWGYFPSVGAAWVMSSEPFMQDQKVVDYFKLRASWGRLGNDNVAASDGFASIATGNGASGVFGNNLYQGFQNTTYFSWLRWEVVNEANVGVNFATLNNRLNVDVDYFYRLTTDAVISPRLPLSNSTLARNCGEIENSGVDLQINWNDKIGNDFKYFVGFNMSYLHNEVKELNGLPYVLGGKTINMVGETMNSYYGYKVTGVYQTPEECAADPVAVANGLVPGDFKYEDVNKDGTIDGSDRQVLGSYIPSITYGINFGFSWKNLDFAISTYGQAGGELYNRKRGLRYAQSNYNFDKAQYENRWTGAGSTNTDPSAAALLKGWNVSSSATSTNSYFVESSDYFRIQNITIGYSFKNIKLGNYTMPGIRLSLTADRPFSFFSANSFTPEVSDPEGWDTEVYPLTATYTFGVQIDF